MTEPSYTQADLQKVAADARMPYAKTYEANLAKLSQLIADANAKCVDSDGEPQNLAYWHGMGDGLRRAVSVLEGRG